MPNNDDDDDDDAEYTCKICSTNADHSIDIQYIWLL